MNFLVILYDYFTIYWKRSILPIIVSIIISCLYFHNHVSDLQIEMITNILGIIFGFTISTLAILISNDNDNITLSKKHELKNNPKYTLYHKIITGLSFTLIIQGFTLLSLLFIPSLLLNDCYISTFTSTILGISFYCIWMLLSTLLELFLVVTRSS